MRDNVADNAVTRLDRKTIEPLIPDPLRRIDATYLIAYAFES